MWLFQDETACQQFLIQQAVLDKIAKGIPITLPNARKFPRQWKAV